MVSIFECFLCVSIVVDFKDLIDDLVIVIVFVVFVFEGRGG